MTDTNDETTDEQAEGTYALDTEDGSGTYTADAIGRAWLDEDRDVDEHDITHQATECPECGALLASWSMAVSADGETDATVACDECGWSTTVSLGDVPTEIEFRTIQTTTFQWDKLDLDEI